MRWILDYRGVELMCAADHRVEIPQTHFHVHTCRSAWCEAKASSPVVARREARIPKVFPTALFTLDEGRLPRLPRKLESQFS
jgi:hypothetical protein